MFPQVDAVSEVMLMLIAGMVIMEVCAALLAGCVWLAVKINQRYKRRRRRL